MERIRTLGQGGFGIVSLYQTPNGHQYAVKEMIHKWNDTYYERFKREIEIMKNLIHKNIVKIVNFNTLKGNPWYVMPYYKSGSLRDRLLDLRSKGQVYSTKAASAIIYYLAKALQYAHSKGVIHRDLKPENILFDDQEPVIADWGIGKFIHKQSKVITQCGLGTNPYCAPEQWETGNSDQRSDIYSLGIIYLELITGTTKGQVTDPKVSFIIKKMTMQNPANRYQSMSEVMGEIGRLNIVSTQNPMDDFWKGVAAVAIGIGIFALLAAALKGK